MKDYYNGVSTLPCGIFVLPRDARNAKRGIAIVSRPSVRLSVTLRYREHTGWTSSKTGKDRTKVTIDDQ